MKEYLPIGTVVLLKGGEKKVMIYGRKQLASDNSGEFDYIACLYPEGNISDDYNFLFNHDDIAEVFFMGYVNEEEKKFLEILNESHTENGRKKWFQRKTR